MIVNLRTRCFDFFKSLLRCTMAFWITKCFKLSQIRYCVKKKKGLDRNQKNYNVRALVQNSGHYIQTKITAEISGKLYIQNLSGSTQSPKRDILTRTELHNPTSNRHISQEHYELYLVHHFFFGAFKKCNISFGFFIFSSDILNTMTIMTHNCFKTILISNHQRSKHKA